MVRAFVILCVGVLLTTACEGQPSEAAAALEQRLQAIEVSQAALRTQAENVALKSEITSSLMHRSPLEDFFSSPEFWENTYDSGQADCSRRCIRDNQQHRAACARLTGTAREQCYNEALQRVTACQRGCAGL